MRKGGRPAIAAKPARFWRLPSRPVECSATLEKTRTREPTCADRSSSAPPSSSPRSSTPASMDSSNGQKRAPHPARPGTRSRGAEGPAFAVHRATLDNGSASCRADALGRLVSYGRSCGRARATRSRRACRLRALLRAHDVQGRGELPGGEYDKIVNGWARTRTRVHDGRLHRLPPCRSRRTTSRRSSRSRRTASRPKYDLAQFQTSPAPSTASTGRAGRARSRSRGGVPTPPSTSTPTSTRRSASRRTSRRCRSSSTTRRASSTTSTARRTSSLLVTGDVDPARRSR